MGQKVDPRSFRLGTTQTWNSKWFSRKDYAKYLEQDIKIKDYLRSKLKSGGLAKIEIKRSVHAINILIYTSRPGVVIGRAGAGIEELKKEIERKIVKDKVVVNINIQEVSEPELNAELVKQNIIEQIEKRVPYRKAMKRAIDQVMKSGAQGVKIILSGRLDGVEIARRETLGQGKIPLHTLRADIGFAKGWAHTIYGSVGVKVWIYKGEIFGDKEKEDKSSDNISLK